MPKKKENHSYFECYIDESDTYCLRVTRGYAENHEETSYSTRPLSKDFCDLVEDFFLGDLRANRTVHIRFPKSEMIFTPNGYNLFTEKLPGALRTRILTTLLLAQQKYFESLIPPLAGQ